MSIDYGKLVNSRNLRLDQDVLCIIRQITTADLNNNSLAIWSHDHQVWLQALISGNRTVSLQPPFRSHKTNAFFHLAEQVFVNDKARPDTTAFQQVPHHLDHLRIAKGRCEQPLNSRVLATKILCHLFNVFGKIVHLFHLLQAFSAKRGMNLQMQLQQQQTRAKP